MKILTGIIALVIMSTTVTLSTNVEDYSDFYKKNKHKENVVSFKLPTGLMSLFLSREDKELKQFLRSIDDLSFFISDDNDPDLLKELKSSLPVDQYKDVMVINDSGDKVSFKARESKDFISEVIMLVEEEGSFVVMSLTGKFSFDDVKKFVKSVDAKKVVSQEAE